MMRTAAEVVALLKLQPHPEGGWYRETFRDPKTFGDRAASTAIYYLLERGQRSHWHRIDAVEMWHHYSGAPLALSISEGKGTQTLVLGPGIGAGHQPQGVVPRFWWQSAESLGEWSLVGCTVAPGFEFAWFEMAEPGWAPD